MVNKSTWNLILNIPGILHHKTLLMTKWHVSKLKVSMGSVHLRAATSNFDRSCFLIE